MISSNFNDVPRHTSDSGSYDSDFIDDFDTKMSMMLSSFGWRKPSMYQKNLICYREEQKSSRVPNSMYHYIMLLICNCPNTLQRWVLYQQST
ncbi:hypothetical protein QL285_060384 [Trifolium repens]|nr:hypothetical protein QL285_060384 [Trifolium repens]